LQLLHGHKKVSFNGAQAHCMRDSGESRNPGFPVETGTQLSNGMIQVLPIRVSTFNQFQFPDSFPFLKPLLSLNGGFHALVQFVPNQLMDAVTFGKASYHIVLMLPYSLDEV
jgi:hypothetical protein